MNNEASNYHTVELNRHRLIGKRQLQALLPLSAMSIWRMEKDGRLPRHVRIGNRSYWRYGEVIEALARLGQGAVK